MSHQAEGEECRQAIAVFVPTCGAIAGAAITIGLCALLLLLQPWRKVPEPALVGIAAIAGLLLH